MMLDLSINRKSPATIVKSFDRIARELMHQWQLNLQGTFYTLTEIEFYYFDKAQHPDTYSHKHAYAMGQWRFHLQGLDISLGFEKEDHSDEYTSYGGILLRGLKSDTEYINGPKRILAHIFKALGAVEEVQKEFGLVSLKSTPLAIYKSSRKGLSDRYVDFNELKYRYYHSMASWNEAHVSPSEKKGIIQKSVEL